MKRKIAISLGDPGGIGAEITLKAIRKPQFKDIQFVLFGNLGHTQKLLQKYKVKVAAWNAELPADTKVLFQDIAVRKGSILNGKIHQCNGQIAIDSLDQASTVVMQKKCDALVTAPLHKQAVKLAGFPFEGHTEFLEAKDHCKKVVMLLAGGGLKVALLTRHVAYKDVPLLLSTKEIVEVTKIVYDSLVKYWKVKSPCIGVMGLNPHASDGGLFGKEEQKIIIPAIKKLEKMGLNVSGPYAPDTGFHLALHQKWDAEICMYHDQGLIPLKTLAFDSGVNITLGLSFIRTSPDHGTAFDIVGKGIASEKSMCAAIEQAQMMCL